MNILLKSALLGSLAAVGFVGLIGGWPLVDRVINYTQTDAIVTAIKIDCYIKGAYGELVDKSTNERIYTNCAAAAKTAREWNFEDQAVRKRTTLKYSYKSVADGSSQVSEHAVESGAYAVGQKIKVYSHNTDPKVSSLM